jgi:hypothetical protein
MSFPTAFLSAPAHPPLSRFQNAVFTLIACFCVILWFTRSLEEWWAGVNTAQQQVREAEMDTETDSEIEAEPGIETESETDAEAEVDLQICRGCKTAWDGRTPNVAAYFMHPYAAASQRDREAPDAAAERARRARSERLYWAPERRTQRDGLVVRGADAGGYEGDDDSCSESVTDIVGVFVVSVENRGFLPFVRIGFPPK